MKTLLAATTSTQEQANDLLKQIEIFKFWEGKDPIVVLVRLFDFLLVLIGGLAVIYTIWSGYQYITSAGDPEKATVGRRSLTNVIVGIVVAVLSFVAVAAVNRTVLELTK